MVINDIIQSSQINNNFQNISLTWPRPFCLSIGSDYDLISVRISTCETTPCKVPIASTVQVTADFFTEGKSKLNYFY